jgi:nucleoside-diphosphate-sugar epimerase
VTVLVTGASGLLGSHLTEALWERGERVRVLARPAERLPWPERQGLEVVRGDLTDRQSLIAAVQGVGRVLHCAARTGPWGAMAEYQQVNVRGLGWLAEAALAAGVQRIVHVSSITVYGNDVRGSADETSPYHSEPNPYTRTKIEGERLLRRLIRERHAPIAIVQPGWIYGPRDAASFARFAAMVEQGKMLVIGRGTNHVPLIHVRDVAQGILLASEQPAAMGRTYLLVNDEPVTQAEYLGRIAAELGVAPPKRHLPYRAALLMGTAAETAWHLLRRRQPPPVMRYGLQMLGGENRFVITRARTELGFVPRVGLHEGVRESVAWYKAQHGPRVAVPAESRAS